MLFLGTGLTELEKSILQLTGIVPRTQSCDQYGNRAKNLALQVEDCWRFDVATAAFAHPGILYVSPLFRFLNCATLFALCLFPPGTQPSDLPRVLHFPSILLETKSS